MLTDRGYDVSTFLWNDNRLYASRNGDGIHAYLLMQGKTGVKQLNEIKNEIANLGIKQLIIVYKQNITSFAKHVIDDMIQDGIDIQLFKDTELYFNLTKHSLVPKHTLLTKEDKIMFIAKYNVKDTNIPYIKKTDPVAKYMGLKIGDVVLINRTSEISDTSHYYRICV